MKKAVRKEKYFYGDDGGNEASSLYHKQLKNKKAHNVDMTWIEELNSFEVSWEEYKTVVYIVMITPYGELANEMDADLLNVYGNYDKALKRALKEINGDINYNGYIVDDEEFNDFKNQDSFSISVWHQELDNYKYYYDLSIIEKEVE